MKQAIETPNGRVSIGSRIHIVHMNNFDSSIDDSAYDGKEGVVECIDDIDGIHGSWGGLALYPTDDFQVL